MRPSYIFTLTSLLTTQIALPLFGAPVTFAARKAIELNSPVLTLADINKDGHTDIVAAVFSPATGDFEVSIQLGSGKGTFTQGPTVDLGTGFTPSAIATGDFNGDGRLDIAVLSTSYNTTNSVDILTQGVSGFTITPIQIPEGTSGTLNMGVADLNGDHLPDLIIPTSSGTILLLSSGGGNFHPLILASSSPTSFVVVADLNGDKKEDLVLGAAQNCCGTTVSVLLGDGRGGFDTPLSQPSFYSVAPRIAVGDFNKDGKLDIVAVSEYSAASVVLALGNGDGTFASTSSFSIPSQTGQPFSIVAGDLNGDGATDLMVLSSNNPNTASLIGFLNEGKGTFGPANIYPVQGGANVVALGNLNSDTYPDAAVYTSGSGSVVSLLFNTGHGSFSDGEVIAASQPPVSLVTGDFNGDGSADLVGLNGAVGLTVYLNNGNNKSLFTPLASLPYYTGSILAGDFNNDGREDVVVINGETGETLLGHGNGTFAQVQSTFSTGTSVAAIVAADMNNDGKLDVVTSSATVNLGNGNGTFQSPFVGNYNYCEGNAQVAVADFNKDGKLDVMTRCEGSLSLYPGNGDGTLQYPVFDDYIPDIQAFVIGDFNRDGFPDVAFTSNPNYYLPGSTEVTILLGQGNGTFITGSTLAVPTGASGLIVAGEFDGNGLLDLAIADNTDAVVSILRGNGDGTFQVPELFGTATAPGCIVSGRFRSGSAAGEQDLVFCTGQGIGVDLNTTTKQ